MRRRDFVVTALGALCGALPVPPAWAAQPAMPGRRELERLHALAQESGQALLVIVVSEEGSRDVDGDGRVDVLSGTQMEQGVAWGTVLNRGSPSTMARFGQCQVVAATGPTAQEVLGVRWARDAWVAVVPTTGSVAPVLEAPNAHRKQGVPTVFGPSSAIDAVRAMVEMAAPCTHPALAQSLAAALEEAQKGATQERALALRAELEMILTYIERSCGSSGALSADIAVASASAREIVASELPDVEADEWLVAMSSMVEAAVGQLLGPVEAGQEAELAAVAVERYRRHAPGNASWARDSGCGIGIEDENGVPVYFSAGCCFGADPIPERRILRFFVGR